MAKKRCVYRGAHPAQTHCKARNHSCNGPCAVICTYLYTRRDRHDRRLCSFSSKIMSIRRSVHMPNQLVRLHLAARVCTCLWHTCCVIVRVFNFVPPPQDLEHLPHDPHFECLQLTGQGFVLHTAFILSAPHLSPPNCGCLVTLRPCQHVWRHASRQVWRHL